MKKVIRTDRAPKAIGPYSQAVQHGDLLFVAGQIGIDPRTGQMIVGNVGDQTRRCIENLRAVLEAAEMDLGNIVKTTIYLASLEDFSEVNKIYGEYFVEDPPARATVEVAGLPLGALVEIEAIARE